MRIEQGKIEGDTSITEEMELHGMIAGNAIVRRGGVLHLHGMVTSDLVVEEGGKVFLRGMVSGDAWNKGGELSIWGTVVGRLIEEAGITRIDENASIGSGGMRTRT